MTTASNIWRL